MLAGLIRPVDRDRPALRPLLEHVRERGDADRRGAPRAGRVWGDQPLVHVVPPGRRGCGRGADGDRGFERLLPPLEEHEPPLGQVDGDSGVHGIDIDVSRSDETCNAVGPCRKRCVVPRSPAAVVDHAADLEDHRVAVVVLGARRKRTSGPKAHAARRSAASRQRRRSGPRFRRPGRRRDRDRATRRPARAAAVPGRTAAGRPPAGEVEAAAARPHAARSPRNRQRRPLRRGGTPPRSRCARRSRPR